MKRNFDQAIADYNKGLGINPNNAYIVISRAVAYYYKKEYDKAWDDVYKAESLGLKVGPGLLKTLKDASGREK